MTVQTPLLLIDNVFDVVSLYPGGVLTGRNETPGYEAFRAIDYRRDRSWYQPTSDGGGTANYILVDLGASMTRQIAYLFIDRGHNLWGRTIYIEGGNDNVNWPVSQSFTVPAQGTVGGDSSWGNLAVTEEGALYSLKGGVTGAERYWRLRIPYVASFVPMVPGLMAGLTAQLVGFSNVFDEDAGGRTESSDVSAAGYRGNLSTYTWRTVELGLGYIGASEYDSTMRTLRTQLFKLNQPAVVFLDYGSYPERGWMYRYDGTTWGLAKNKAYRSGRIRLRELGTALP